LDKCIELDIDINKSLWIWGDIGSGKSIAMKVFQEFCFFTPHINRRFSIYRYKKIEKDYDEIKSKIFEDYGHGSKKDICYDEFLKHITVNNFGVKKNLPEELIEERYDSFIEFGFKTHLTTNVPPIYIKENKILDEMSLDRCSQMFNIIEWIGGSKRK
jgi:hypothetical protein